MIVRIDNKVKGTIEYMNCSYVKVDNERVLLACESRSISILKKDKDIVQEDYVDVLYDAFRNNINLEITIYPKIVSIIRLLRGDKVAGSE